MATPVRVARTSRTRADNPRICPNSMGSLLTSITCAFCLHWLQRLHQPQGHSGPVIGLRFRLGGLSERLPSRWVFYQTLQLPGQRLCVPMFYQNARMTVLDKLSVDWGVPGYYGSSCRHRF